MILTNRLLMIAALSALASAGCAMPKMPTWEDWSVTRFEDRVKETKYQAPTRMVVLWSPAIQNGPDVPKAQRGFGGRIYFYNAADQAVPVEGQLIVYGYNDTAPNQRHVKPDKKFTFTPRQFTSHYSPTELGASYSVWVGWDDVGGPQSEVSLVPIFTGASGHIVVGQTSRNTLPGPTTPSANTQIQKSTIAPQVHDERLPPAVFPQPTTYTPASPSTHGMVEQASYQQAAMYPPQQPGQPMAGPYGVQQASMQQTLPGMPQQFAQPGMPMPGAQPKPLQMETMSINLPSTLAQRLATAGSQSNAPQPMQTVGQNGYAVSNVAPQQQPGIQPYGVVNGQVVQLQQPSQPPGAFNAPTNSSRSWGPVTPRRGALPLGPQSRYEPGSPQAPASQGPRPFAGPPPTQPPHGALGQGHPQPPQSGLPAAGQAGAGAAPGIRL